MTAKTLFKLALLAFCCAVFVRAAASDQPWQEVTSARPLAGDPATIPFLDSSDGPLAAVANQPAASLIPWSRVAYQGYQDGNWDIYSGPDDGSNPVRLTDHPATDMMPRLSRGGSKIVFVSERAAPYYQIFTINPDGSGVVQLTATAADNVRPVWSPDGAKIAFESYRDGQGEVYVMNADGSGQTRLTAGGGFNGQPAWSPDGTKLAFVSYRTGGYRIWTMQADGSSQVQLSNQPYSFRPIWSPNGSQIAYDADGEENGWQELWLMQANGGNQQMVSPNHNFESDSWANSWSPDGRYLAYTQIDFIYYQGNWYWTMAYLLARDLVPPNNIISLAPGDTNWNGDWQTLDAEPPVSSVTSLPAYSRRHNFLLRWSGLDGGGSGLAGYDVQVRQNGVWNEWQNRVASTFAPYSAAPGTTVSFRSRAYDGASNWEAWSASPDATTTFYTWELDGRITDNRGVPLAGVPLTLAPSPLQTPVTDDSGHYLGRLLADGNHSVNLSRSGYGSWPATTLAGQGDQTHDFYLPPQGNLLLNSGFEASPPLNYWTASGTMPSGVTTVERSTGQQAATAGFGCAYPCLGEAETIPGPAYQNEGYAIVSDSLGQVHLLYADNNNSPTLYYRYRNLAGEWSNPTAVSMLINDGDLFLAIDGHDHLYAAWETGGGYFHFSAKAPGEAWLPPYTVSPPYSHINGLDVGSDGAVHILAHNDLSYHIERLPSGEWRAPVLLPSSQIDLAVGPNGTVYNLTSQNDCQLLLRTYVPGGSWSEPAVYPGASACYFVSPRLVPDSQGTLHMFWQGDAQQLWYGSRNAQQQWSVPQLIAPTWQVIEAKLDTFQNLHLFTISVNGVLHYRRWRPGVGWDELVPLNQFVPYKPPALAISPDGTLHLVLQDGNDGRSYVTTPPATTTGDGRLQQSVAIPMDINAPTLAFRYLLKGDEAGDLSGLEVSTSNGVSETAASLAGNGEWQHGWLDLSAYAGDNVTVAFELHQEAGEPAVRLYLDDVSVGTSYPDLFVTSSGQAAALPGDTVQWTLHYGNRGGVMASEATVSAALPPGLTFVAASIPPATTLPSLVWSPGDLEPGADGTIVITVTVAPSAAPLSTLSTELAIESAGPEIEMGNNMATAAIWIGRQLYLPLVTRP